MKFKLFFLLIFSLIHPLAAMEKESAKQAITYAKFAYNDLLYIFCKRGFAELGKIQCLENEILYLKVHEERSGIGSELCIRALQHIQAQGYERAFWSAAGTSPEFYKKLGARIIEQKSKNNFLPIMEFDFKRDGDPRNNRNNHLKIKVQNHENK